MAGTGDTALAMTRRETADLGGFQQETVYFGCSLNVRRTNLFLTVELT